VIPWPIALDGFYFEPFQSWFDIRILPMEHGVAAHISNVTAVRQAEAAREAAARQLQQVFDATTDAVVSLDRQWRFTFLNRRAREVLGAKGNLLGSNLWESFPDAVYEGSPYLEYSYPGVAQR
jgi:PAS domain-containing protein